MAGARRGAEDGRAGGLWIGVLGPVLVRRDGAEIQPGTPDQRAVLALAALDALASRESIIDALWEENPPVTAVAIVQTYVSRLRALLGTARDGGRILARAGSGYRLRVADDAVDLRVFRRLAGEARHAREAGDATGACDAYERALGLWRGEPAEDVEALRTHPAVTALTAERAAVTREFADLASALGWDEKALPHLRSLAARDPLDEASQARLMRALAGCGRQAEALQLYEDVRRRLDDQLAVTPGPELRAAHAQVLRQEIPSAADEWRPVFQLPATVADFSGRAADFGKLAAALVPRDGQPGVPVVAVCGQPGVGKTSLALHAAHTLRERFPDGQLWAHLAGASERPQDPGDVLGEFLRALGVPGPAIPEDGQERAACYRSRLAGRRVLVVADDAASAAQVRPLVPGTAGCAVLVTSRSQLDALAGAALLPLGVMTRQDAARLLTRMVGPDRAAAEPAAVDALIDACGALPLALRIAGGKLAARPVWPVSAVLRRITREQSRLQELEVGDLSVRASIASSYQALPDRARRLFRRLSLLGPADFADWLPGVLLGEPDASRVTDELVGQSLLMPVSPDYRGEPRYRLHDLLRDYAGERLKDETAASREAAMDRALEAWFQLARLAGTRLPPEAHFAAVPGPRLSDVIPAEAAAELTADPIAWFYAERGNLRTAIEYACTPRRWELAAQLAACLWSCRYLVDPRDEERLWRSIAEAAHQAGDEVGAARASLKSAAGTLRRGYPADAASLLDACIQRFQDGGASKDLTLALSLRADCSLELSEYEAACRTADWGRAVARQIGDRHAELRPTQILGLALVRTGQHEAGIATGEQAVSIAAELGLNPGPAVQALARACSVAGQHQRALSLSAELFESARRATDPEGYARALMVMADAYHAMGRFQDMRDALSQAEPIFRAVHARHPLANCLLMQGYAHQAMGSAEAVPLLEESLQMYRELQLPRKVEAARRALDLYRKVAQVTRADGLSGSLPRSGPGPSPARPR